MGKIFTLILLLLTQTTHAQNLVYSSPVITGLSAPVDIVNAADGTNRLFVVQRGGIIKVYGADYSFLGNLVTVSGISFVGGCDERGLLSVAFHPDYENNRFFYVWYTTLDGSNNNYVNLARYQTRADNPNLADDTSRHVLLTIAKPAGSGFTNHNGARLLFGQDGYLYFATGDGGSSNDPFQNAQNGNSLLGKMIRLNVNTGATAFDAPYYTIPADNPYVSDANVRDEIYAMGLRNPYRWSFDRATGDMWIGDVGQATKEEIDYRPAGPPAPLNFGWRCYEGFIANPGVPACTPYGTYTPPIYDYPNPGTGAAVTGGVVYRGPDYGALQGIYMAADVYSGTHYKIKKTGPNTFNVTTQAGPTNTVAFGEAENGKVYAVSLSGSVSEITTNSTLPIKLANFNAIRKNDRVDVSWKTASETNVKAFVLEYSLDGRSYQQAATVTASNNTNGSSYSVQHLLNASGVIYYRLKIENTDDGFDYSLVLAVLAGKQTGANIPSTIRNNRLVLTVYEPYNTLRVVSPAGSTVFSSNIAGMTGLNEITLPELPAGAYVVQLTGKGKGFCGRVVIAR